MYMGERDYDRAVQAFFQACANGSIAFDRHAVCCGGWSLSLFVHTRTLLTHGHIPPPRVHPFLSHTHPFSQSFKSYDEAGDPRRLTLLKYLVLASMLHKSTIDPFDSQVGHSCVCVLCYAMIFMVLVCVHAP